MNESLKSTIKMVVSHFFIITVCVLTVIGVSNLFSTGFQGYPKEFPLHLLLIGATSSLPSLLFYFRKEPTRKQFLLRIFLHFCCIQAVVLGEGWFLGWYDNIVEMAVVAGCVIVVYAAVWFITKLAGKSAAEGINNALQNINEEE